MIAADWASKIESSIVSLFTSAYVFHWSTYLPNLPMTYPPSFDSRAIMYPSSREVRDYFAWRQADSECSTDRVLADVPASSHKQPAKHRFLGVGQIWSVDQGGQQDSPGGSLAWKTTEAHDSRARMQRPKTKSCSLSSGSITTPFLLAFAKGARSSDSILPPIAPSGSRLGPCPVKVRPTPSVNLTRVRSGSSRCYMRTSSRMGSGRRDHGYWHSRAQVRISESVILSMHIIHRQVYKV